MDTPSPPTGHGEPRARELVYCHQCGQEWYRADHGLLCPYCEGDFTEIISPEPEPEPSSASTSPEMPPYHPGSGDSDPDEADIEEHTGPHGFHYRRSVLSGPNRDHHQPEVEPVLERFVSMINTFGPPQRPAEEAPPVHQYYSPFGEAHVRHATVSTSGGGRASFTFVSGPAPARAFGEAHQGEPRTADTFQAYDQPSADPPDLPGPSRVIIIARLPANTQFRLLASIMRDLGPPDEPQPASRPLPPFTRNLREILNLLGNSIGEAHGDAVYSQEALDRIITNLMETNPSSNAAPPASEEALGKLDRRPMDQSMMNSDGKTECTICIDDMNLGDTAAILPCKHLFHEECVLLWLKQHNTCPVCRAPIEKQERSPPVPAQGSTDTASISMPTGAGHSPASEPVPDYTDGEGSNRPFSFGGAWLGSPATRMSSFGPPSPGEQSSASRPARLSRPPSQSQSRLNEAMRTLSSRQMDRERERTRDRATSSGTSYDSPFMSRRNSLSPTSPRAGDQASRIRHRSPSSSSRRTGDSDSRRQASSHGPISWLRDRFSGGGSSGSGPSREGRRG
ncbi:hypothetical protein B0I35DRAFT_472690 [Stachybotrys elegans]|uniref:RING-type E3 ubiquitin transferase n=1 Tax=Stachybotrys elegans TaxID=80388 RepID=A0A8K0T0C1_9HYPO|nr:hypothetical protein B0I35DRAFT_472690 [Stachybotrys elegans]